MLAGSSAQTSMEEGEGGARGAPGPQRAPFYSEHSLEEQSVEEEK